MIHICKSSLLTSLQARVSPPPASEEAVFGKGFDYAAANPHCNLGMVCTIESLIPKLLLTLGMEFRWKIKFMLKKSTSSVLNMTRNELKAIKSLKLKDTTILQEDKGNCTVVLDESEYEDKLHTFQSLVFMNHCLRSYRLS